MKKNKLFVEHHYDFDLLGFVTPLKDYKMAWLLNRTLGTKLIKIDDYELEFLDQTALAISQYFQEMEHGFVQLLKNRSVNKTPSAVFLVPELKMFDYFLLVQDHTFDVDINDYIERLSTVVFIQNVVKLDITKIKSKENLLTY